MAVAEQDTRLRKALKDTRGTIAAYGFEDDSKAWADQAIALLDSRFLMFDAAVEAEDDEEVDVAEAQVDVSEARVELKESFTQMWNGYQMRLSELKLAGEFNDQAMELGEYLSGMSPSDFTTGDIERAVSAVKRGRRFGEKFLPESYRDQFNGRVDAAVARIDAARAAERTEEGEANAAYTELLRAREMAPNGYQSARDLLKAALRESARLERLDTLMPSLSAVLRGWHVTSDDEEPEPAPEPRAPLATACSAATASRPGHWPGLFVARWAWRWVCRRVRRCEGAFEAAAPDPAALWGATWTCSKGISQGCSRFFGAQNHRCSPAGGSLGRPGGPLQRQSLDLDLPSSSSGSRQSHAGSAGSADDGGTLIQRMELMLDG